MDSSGHLVPVFCLTGTNFFGVITERYGDLCPFIKTQLIVPKNGSFPVILNPARISGCPSQKEASLQDQHDHATEVVSELWEGAIEEVEFRLVSTKGKGEDLTRPELAEIESELKTGEIDLLILEDIGRLVRGTEASRLIGIAVDFGTRMVSPNDCIDTNDEGWEEDVISACRDHVGHNAHTSKRLKKKADEPVPEKRTSNRMSNRRVH